MTCTFFGHRDFPREMTPILRAQIVQLIEKRGKPADLLPGRNCEKRHYSSKSTRI